MNKKTPFFVLIICVVACLATTQGSEQYDLSIFNETFDIIQQKYINPLEINIQKFRIESEKEFLSSCSGQCFADEAERKIDNILRKVNDPHLRLVPNAQLTDDAGDVVGSFSHYQHYGLRLLEKNQHIVVTRVQPKSPAAKAGIVVGDEIVSFENLKDKKEIFQTLATREYHEKSVFIGIFTRSGQNKTIKLTSSAFRWESYIEKINTNTSIIYVPNLFPTGIADVEVHSLIKKALENGSKKLILDLRFNEGGGAFGSANVLGAFVDKVEQIYTSIDNKIVKYRYENGMTYSERSNEPGKITTEAFENPSQWKYPVAILVGPNTFSISETLTANFQKYKRGIVIGESTWGGGGVVTDLFPIKTGANLLLPIYRISNTDGTLLPLKVTPDINLPLDLVGLTKGHDNQIEAAVKYLDNQK